MGIWDSLLGALVTAALSTLGDYLWANVLPHGRPAYGFAHGAILFFTVGFFLGRPSRQPMRGAIGGVLIGLGGTAGFYLLLLARGYYDAFVMFVMYAAVWIGLGLLTGRVLEKRDTVSGVFVRSGLAALGSGLGFYAVIQIWFPFDPHGWDYAKHFVYWTLAYLPAFAALLIQINRSSLRR